MEIGGILDKFDIVIPCHPKDKDNLIQSVKSLRNLSNKRKVYIISPDKIDLGIPDEYNYISDSSFDKYFTIEQIKQRWITECPHFAYRASWIYQQLIKLFSYKVIEDLTESFLFLDSDTMILKDIDFNTSKFQFSIPQENESCYKKCYKYMTSLNAENFSFISHHMMFKKEYLNELISYIERLHNKDFFNVLLDSMDYTIQSPFSEWELYGNWVFRNHSEICECRQLKAIDINYIPNDEQMKELGKQFDLVSSHAWIRGIQAK